MVVKFEALVHDSLALFHHRVNPDKLIVVLLALWKGEKAHTFFYALGQLCNALAFGFLTNDSDEIIEVVQGILAVRPTNKTFQLVN
mmetsp:Transcript_40021/g.52400  ORF Transcript_40021/g.52400 Transcript_40021/m.52400 type:complete len:86 (-) Transcript_40021:491-748(-)